MVLYPPPPPPNSICAHMYCTVYSDPGRVVGEGGPESRVVRNTFETLLVLGNSTLPSENEAICDFYQDQISRAGT